MPNHSDIPSRGIARIDLSAIRHNVKALRGIWGEERSLMGIVKAGAYGHGIAQVANVLAPEVEMFGVSGLAEARQLQQALENPEKVRELKQKLDKMIEKGRSR